MRLALRGTPWECQEAATRLATVLEVICTAGPYPDPGASGLVRVYLEARIPDGDSPGGATPIRPESPAGHETSDPRLIRPESPPAGSPAPGDQAEDPLAAAPADVAGEASAVVVLPESDGEIPDLLSDLDEVLAGIAAWAAEEAVSLPAALPAERAGHAVAHLASLSRAWEQALRDLEASGKVLAAPDGFDLVALHVVELDAGDLAAIVAAIASLAGVMAGWCHPGGRRLQGVLKEASPQAAELVVEALYARSDDPAALIGRAERLGALLALPPDDDVELLRGRLGTASGTAPAPISPTKLSPAEYRAYLGVTERILATWHAGDRLARFLYRGSRP